MIPFQAFQFAMMGSAVAEMRDTEREQYTYDLEGHQEELQDYAETLSGEYEKLRSEYTDLQQYPASVETDRDQLTGR